MELLENEIYKKIDGYPHYYITSFGRVWSDYTNRWLKPTINTKGKYSRAYISLGRGNKKYIHRLVAQAFIPNPNECEEVDHIDRNPLNNHVENLRWATRQENMENELTQEVLKSNTGFFKEVINLETGETFLGLEAAAQAAGVSRATVINHTRNLVKKPKWQYTGKIFNPKKLE